MRIRGNDDMLFKQAERARNHPGTIIFMLRNCELLEIVWHEMHLGMIVRVSRGDRGGNNRGGQWIKRSEKLYKPTQGLIIAQVRSLQRAGAVIRLHSSTR